MVNVKLVVLFLGVTEIILVVGIIMLTALDRTTPDVLVTLAVADLTGLTGILVKTGEAGSGANNRRELPEEDAA